ncbi:glycosyltransferase [uncultured Parabacteroides sp.]|uniref:glycosyltransferase family 32 protein n=1 Tax=uncultured Parabacteroides sp. TaxID=512312 RepID=UPI002617CCCC|nr:glycosyltransferase [uncultured Parabacteroides sp.]
MIPKVIHYCWFGGHPLPSLAVRCIESWKKFLPDYEIKEWNESNFDVSSIPYTQEAYAVRKYAFVSDYVRFKVLYEQGGIYFDTDVEVIKAIDDIVARGPFMGCEFIASNTNEMKVNPGLGLGVTPGLDLYRELLDLYTTLHFKNNDGTFNLKTVVKYTTEILYLHGLKNMNDIQECAGVWIYPKEYFCPIVIGYNELQLTENSRSIHHYAGTWLSSSKRFKRKIIKYLGPNIVDFYLNLLKRL